MMWKEYVRVMGKKRESGSLGCGNERESKSGTKGLSGILDMTSTWKWIIEYLEISIVFILSWQGWQALFGDFVRVSWIFDQGNVKKNLSVETKF